MTRKDYVAIAAIIKNAQAYVQVFDTNPAAAAEYMRRSIACDLMQVLAADNSRFDSARFAEACELPRDSAIDPETWAPMACHY